MPKITAKLADVNHPNGQRIVGGVVWGVSFQTVNVSKASESAIRRDPALVVLDKPETVEAPDTAEAPEVAETEPETASVEEPEPVAETEPEKPKRQVRRVSTTGK